MNMKIILLFICFFQVNVLSAKSYNPLPKDIAELVDSADLIVIGTFGQILDHKPFYGYGVDQNKMAKIDEESAFNLSLPLVDYEINVQKVIMEEVGDEPIIFRTFEDELAIMNPVLIKQKTGKIIFFLTINPDSRTYGIKSAMHWVKLKENKKDRPSYSVGYETIDIPFHTTTDKFLSDVKKYVKTNNL